jgi:pimeloyl-ACP methyl ester carboxylesterase
MSAMSASLLLALLLAASSARAADELPHFASFNGIQVHYETYGSGDEALVFIHGWTCDLTFWRGQAPVYQEHRSLLIDLPGHGQSDKPKIAYPSELFARAVEAVMKDAQVSRATLIGHSLGGNIAYTFVRLFPEKVKSVVFVDSYVTQPPPASAVQATLARYRQTARNLSGPAGERNFIRQVNAMFSHRTPAELCETIRAKMLATPEYVRVAAVTSISKLPPPSAPEAYDMPVLAVAARVSGDMVRAFMRPIFPHLQVEKWQNYGHFLMMEDPERFNRTLEHFLAERP